MGRCDANCHNAHSTPCNCICGGRNHGVGFLQACQNNYDRLGLTPEDVEQFAKAHGYDPKDLTVYDTLKMPAYKIRRERKREARAEALRKAYEERQRRAS